MLKLQTDYLEEYPSDKLSCNCLYGRGPKSGGTGEPGSQKVNWPAESFWTER